MTTVYGWLKSLQAFGTNGERVYPSYPAVVPSGLFAVVAESDENLGTAFYGNGGQGVTTSLVTVTAYQPNSKTTQRPDPA
ncbi:MAG: hypothetical protein ACRDAM_20795, partial [Casimicrobium sp.]